MVTSSICVAAPAVSAAAGSSSAEAKAALNNFIVMLTRPFVCMIGSTDRWFLYIHIIHQKQ